MDLPPRPQPERRAAVTGTPRTRRAILGLVVATALLTGSLSLLTAGCADEPPAVSGSRGDTLQPGVAVRIDLNGDGASDKVLLDGSAGVLTLSGPTFTYRSRAKWHITAACLADCDGNGLPEVVALLDDSEGRHLGLFGCATTQGDSCRELIVTAALQPQPVGLQVRRNKAGGDLLVLTEKTSSGTRDVLYRWNGFGFTALP